MKENKRKANGIVERLDALKQKEREKKTIIIMVVVPKSRTSGAMCRAGHTAGGATWPSALAISPAVTSV